MIADYVKKVGGKRSVDVVGIVDEDVMMILRNFFSSTIHSLPKLVSEWT